MDGVRLVEIVRLHVNQMLDEVSKVMREEGAGLTAGPSQMAAPSGNGDSIPDKWVFVESREGETYSWPELEEEYTRFDVYEGRAPNGEVSFWAIGECERTQVWGRDRKYYIVFWLGAGRGSKQPICEFLEADDYGESTDLVAIVRGSGGPRGQRMFDPGDTLPEPYDGLRIETYRDRIPGTSGLSGWNKLAVVAREDDHESMLRHAAIQVNLRHR